MGLPERLIQEPDSRRDPRDEVDYPSSRGLALQGTIQHILAIHLAHEALRRHFRGRRDVFVAPLFALYYRRGDNSQCLYPDLMVARGVDRQFRRSYKTWEAPVPQFVLEVASRSTVDRDRGFKMEEYRRLGVREYWQLDQEGGLLPRQLMGHRLRRGRYEEIGPGGQVGLARQYRSEVLGLLLRTAVKGDGLTVVFRDPRTGKDVLTDEQMDKALRDQREISRLWERRARVAERQLEDLERQAEAARVRAKAAEGRANAAEGRAEAANRRTEAANQRTEAAEGRAERAEDLVAKLTAQLRALGHDSLA